MDDRQLLGAIFFDKLWCGHAYVERIYNKSGDKIVDLKMVDPKLMDYLAQHQIGIECCPTSNIQTSTVASYQTHPIKQFLAHGMLVSLNTDDPGVSDIEIGYEYNEAAKLIGLTNIELLQLDFQEVDRLKRYTTAVQSSVGCMIKLNDQYFLT